MILHIILLLTVALAGAKHHHEVEEPNIHLTQHFEQLSERRHPFYRDGLSWLEGRKYIADKMHYLGLRSIIRQSFNTTVDDKEVEGVNLIGIMEGEDPTKSVMVVGADYATALEGNHLKDNTGGIVCLLEIIHLFVHDTRWNYFHQNFTVIFVAFDLNTKEFQTSGNGQSGSYYFVHDWLVPYLIDWKQPKEFLGAIILDSVTTYNTGEQTQLLRKGFDEAMPEAAQYIRGNDRKGDFLGLLYPFEDRNNSIVSTFEFHYNQIQNLNEYRLQEMPLRLQLSLMTEDVFNTINHQAHYYFWTSLQEDIHLPAVLLYDTGDDRLDPSADVCNIDQCDVQEFLTVERLNFMKKTVSTTVHTLLNLQTTFKNSSAIYSRPSVVLIVTPLVLSFIISNK